MNTIPLEADTRLLIDRSLENLGWNLTGKDKNVFMEQPRTEEERQSLEHKRPDYVLYSANHEPLIVIEAKKKGEKIDSALEQGIFYAKRLKAPLVFATDGVFCKAFHTEGNCPPLLNGNELDEFIRQALALKFIGNWDVNTISPKVQYDRKTLISIFDYANNLLRGDGLSAGLERFSEFSNILFLKLLSEKGVVNEAYSWEIIKKIPIKSRIDYINSTVFKALNEYYNDTMEIFTPLSMSDNDILDEIIKSLDPLTLTDVDSDIKGDAFEYFLKASTSSGNDLGEYFTPRHIVKTMVRLTNPKIGEKVYDPFCGTGGFLIESFRHIYNNMPRNATTEKMLRENTIFGNEITKTARITKMNMILAGDGHSGIQKLDSLANPVDGKYDVVLANMPYSQQTKYGTLYDVPTKNGDSVCVQHCMNSISALSENGRMALVVPEGFLFRKDLKKTREYMLNKCELKSIISLPQGVFLPYTGVKTNIIYAEKVNQKIPTSQKSKNYWYFEVKNDGYSLDNYRRKLPESDLQTFESYRKFDSEQEEDMLKVGFDIVPFEKVREKDFNFVGKRYREIVSANSNFEIITLEELEDREIISISKGKTITKATAQIGSIPVIAGGQTSPYNHNEYNYTDETITVSASGAYAGFVWYHNYPVWASDCSVIVSNNKNILLTKFLYHILKHKQDTIYSMQRGSGQPHIYPDDIRMLSIPLPPLEVQEKIVAQLEDYQNIIDGAKKVIENYKPSIDINILQKYPITELGNTDLFEIISGGTPSSQNDKYWNGNINWITLVDLPANDYITNIYRSERKITQEGLNHSSAKLLPVNSVIVSSRATIGRIGINRIELATNQGFKNIVIKNKNIITPEFLAFYLKEKEQELINLASGVTFKEVSKSSFETITINIPPMNIQKDIINRIGTEQELICPAYKLIDLFTKKIHDTIDNLFKE